MRFRSMAIALMALTVLAACGVESDAGAPADGTTTSAAPSAASTSKDEGAAIDVRQRLIDQGFKVGQIGVVDTNSSYLLLPFTTPYNMSATDTSCAFRMRNQTYPGNGPLAEHTILENSKVRITMQLLSVDGVYGPVYPEEVITTLAEVTPQMLATNSSFKLTDCGDTTVR